MTWTIFPILLSAMLDPCIAFRSVARIASRTARARYSSTRLSSACAPDTTSMISRVIAAWRTLFM